MLHMADQDRRRARLGNAGDGGEQVALAAQIGMAVDVLGYLLLDRGAFFVNEAFLHAVSPARVLCHESLPLKAGPERGLSA
jgi:hypothetical protein